RRQLPDLRERRVVEFEFAVGPEHRDAFLQCVQGRGLDLDERVEGAFKRDALGHIFVEERQAAERMRLWHDPQRLAARQVPELFGQEMGGWAGGGETVRVPGLIVALLRKFAALTQAVEDFAVARMRVEPRLGQTPKLRVSTVVEAQLCVLAEDRDRRGEAIE